ncbi:hypothetical protein DN069_34335 [Streptacidiphilus pinicola]|uniref:Uncharacterized protein n=1 Tax=Streptacidiphilus pinicola TaxID=2219663 RepID=A0A2X0J1F8_9ACTN|nr:hypothetical protein DN069_34335 [Streptacidiphilus pinicola]
MVGSAVGCDPGSGSGSGATGSGSSGAAAAGVSSAGAASAEEGSGVVGVGSSVISGPPGSRVGTVAAPSATRRTAGRAEPDRRPRR